MSYIKQTWIDRLTEFYRRFSAVEDASGNVQLTDEPGVITDEGSPISAARLNHMEDGIEGAHNDIGSRTYTEQNYATNGESVTDSIDALDTNLNLVQSGGLAGAFSSMPFVGTAPIVESDSNANGSWIKYADGTSLFYGQYSGVKTVGAGASVLAPLPSGLMISDNYFQFADFTNHSESATNNYRLGNYLKTTSNMNFLYRTVAGVSPTAGTSVPTFYAFAIGRWK